MAHNKIYLIFLAFVLHFTAFNSAYASTSSALGGWNIVNRGMEGASRVFNASKTAVINGANVAKTSIAKYKPTTAQVAKGIGRTGAVAVVAFAIEQLIGAVSYTMDPANNRVIYYNLPDEQLPHIPKVWTYYSAYQQVGVHSSANSACQAMIPYSDALYPSYQVIKAIVSSQNATSATCQLFNKYDLLKDLYTLSYVNNPYYDPDAKDDNEEKYLPYSAIAAEIIGEAEGGDTRAGGYVGEVADWELANTPSVQQNVKQQLDANAKTQTAEAAGEATGNTKPNAANPDVTDISLEFPAFCGWAPTVCEAAQTVIAFPTTVTNWWDTATSEISDAWALIKEWVRDATDYFKDEPDSDTQIDIDSPLSPDINTNVNFGGQCPAPIVSNYSFHGQSIQWGITDFSPLCDVLSSFLRPVVISISSFIAVLIIAGVRTDE